MRLDKYVEGLIANNHQIIDGFIAHVDKEKPKNAIIRLGVNFNGPILEFAF